MSDWDDDYYSDEWATCDSVGMGGNCGDDCPVFLRGGCEVAAEALDTIVEMINDPTCDRTLESYDERIQDMINDRTYDEQNEKIKENNDDFDHAMDILN